MTHETDAYKDNKVKKLENELAAARIQIAGLILANKSLAESNDRWVEQVKRLRDEVDGL